jgi:hypothetical protein
MSVGRGGIASGDQASPNFLDLVCFLADVPDGEVTH